MESRNRHPQVGSQQASKAKSPSRPLALWSLPHPQIKIKDYPSSPAVLFGYGGFESANELRWINVCFRGCENEIEIKLQWNQSENGVKMMMDVISWSCHGLVKEACFLYSAQRHIIPNRTVLHRIASHRIHWQKKGEQKERVFTMSRREIFRWMALLVTGSQLINWHVCAWLWSQFSPARE